MTNKQTVMNTEEMISREQHNGILEAVERAHKHELDVAEYKGWSRGFKDGKDIGEDPIGVIISEHEAWKRGFTDAIKTTIKGVSIGIGIVVVGDRIVKRFTESK